MTLFSRLSGLAALCLLAACTTTTEGPPLAAASSTAPPPSGAASSYGLYLAGRAAIAGGDPEHAADLLHRASQEDRQTAMLSQRAFEAALASGDLTRAAQLAPQGRDADDDNPRRLGLLARGVDALAAGRGGEALTALTTEDMGILHRGAAGVLTPWAAAAAGRAPQALAAPDVGSDTIASYFGRLGQGRLQERAGRLRDAEQTFRGLIGEGDPQSMASLALGAMFERRGRAPDAIAVYEAALARTPGDYAVQLARLRARTGRERPPLPTIREGAAAALIGPARGMLLRSRADLALAYVRMALRLDPAQPEALMLLGDMLIAAGDGDGARAAYAGVPRSTSSFALARAKLAWSFQREGQGDRAIAEARAVAATLPPASGASLTLAELLRSGGRYAEADQVLTRIIEDASIRPDWRLFYMRANARVDAGRATDAEADLQRGLQLSPQQPELLTLLGSTWIDRGERLDEAMAMVRRAAEAEPNSAAVQDSIGWGLYRQGQYAQAVETLEQAVLLWPANARINDHLGDAYWRVGRRTEAVFQWRRALGLEPDARIRASAEAKIASPLGPDAPPATAPPPSAS